MPNFAMLLDTPTYSTVQYSTLKTTTFVCMCVQPYLTTIIVCMLRKPNHGDETLAIDSCVHRVQCTMGRDVAVVFDGFYWLGEAMMEYMVRLHIKGVCPGQIN